MYPILSNKRNKNIALVYYHASCPDGLMAAMVAKRYLDQSRDYSGVLVAPTTYGRVEVVPSFMLTYGSRGVRSRFDIFLVDYCPSEESLEFMMGHGSVASVTVIDHHKTTLEKLDAFKEILAQPTSVEFSEYYSATDSGASLTLKYFESVYPDYKLDKDFKEMVENVRAYDLWEHDGDNRSAAAHTAVGLAAFYRNKAAETVSLWGIAEEPKLDTTDNNSMRTYFEFHTTVIEKLLGLGRSAIVHAGYEENERIIKRAGELLSQGFMTPEGIMFVGGVDGSEVNEVANQARFAYPRNLEFTVCFQKRDDGIKLSFRAANADIDLSELAGLVAPGGGGHRTAAGCKILLKPGRNHESDEQAMQSVIGIVRKAWEKMKAAS